MSLVERIKFLCEQKNTSFAEVERKVGISNGQIRRWDKSSPKLENVKKVADHFNVSLDYLAGVDEKVNYLKKNVVMEDLIGIFEENDFEVEINNEEGVEKVYINHFNYGTVEEIELNFFIENGESILKKLKDKYITDEVHTIAAHHDGEEWTEEELKTIEEFKKFVKSQRHNKG